MSGPISAPLTVSTVDGTVTGRPISVIKVSNGDLTISGNQAVIDTSGSGGLPGTPANSIQFNSEPAGTFTGSDRLLFETGSNNAQIFMKSGNAITQPEVRAVDGWGLQLSGTSVAGAQISQVVMFGENDATEGIILLANNVGGTGAAVTIYNGELTTSGAGTSGGDLTITTGDDATKAKITLEAGANGNILVQTDNTGVFQLENNTTDFNSTLTVMGNGAGTPTINLKNATKEVRLTCEDDDKLYVRGPTSGDRFTFDASSATGGITFPDSTTLVSAEATAILSTGETGATKFLREDGDGTCSWQAAGGGGGATELSGLSDVLIDATNWLNGFLIQTNSAGSAPTTGTLSSAGNNIGIGSDVFKSITTSDRCLALGEEAAVGLTTGGDNVALGAKAMSTFPGATTGTQRHNVAIGTYCMSGILNGAAENVGIGYQTLDRALTGEGNTSVGFYSGRVTTGNNNLMLGTGSGNITTGSNNVLIGKAGADDATADEQLVISSGDATPFWIKGDSAGSCYQGDNATTWSTTSDQRLKRDIQDTTIGLDSINAVRVRNFRYIEKAEPIIETETREDGIEHERTVGYEGENRYNLDPEPLRVGVIAQEFQEVFPDGVKENLNGHLTVNPDSMNWALIKAVQELSAKVEALEAMIE